MTAKATPNTIASPFLLTDDAAAYLGMTSRTLYRLRTQGTGPKYAKLGGKKIGYRREWLDQWVDARAVHSTAEAKRLGIAA